ncbi:MAG: ABC transporter, partial [Clostridiales bacterium]|nr:ABC transporter [Clostridiales bacterium]
LGFFLLGAALIAICMFMSSLTESQIIAAVTSFGVVLALYLMSGLASLLPTTAVGSFVAFLILGAAFGLIVWALTRDTLIGVIAAGVVIIPTSIFYFVNQEAFAGLFPSIISYLAVFDRFDVFVSGIFDLTAVVYYLSIIVFFVFLTVQSLEKRRWS